MFENPFSRILFCIIATGAVLFYAVATPSLPLIVTPAGFPTV